MAYLGWEWTQIGTTPDNHYGHKNVILRGLEDDEIPTRPITVRLPGIDDEGGGGLPGPLLMRPVRAEPASRRTLLDSMRFMREMADVPACPDGVPVRELPDDCREYATTPADLFAKLDEWGFDSMVIPHGTTWGLYTPMGSAWDKQLVGNMHDPARQKLIEVFSGHGNSEEFRAWREVVIDADGDKSCPGPRNDYLPSCWRAGEIVRARCAAAGEDEDGVRGARRRRRARTTWTATPSGYLTRARRDGRGLARLRAVPRLLPARLQLPAAQLGAVHHGARRLRRPRAARAASTSASWRRATTTPRGPAPATRSSRART